MGLPSISESVPPRFDHNGNKLGLIGATSYITGTIIGSGIFVSPKGILMHTGSVALSLIVWAVCGVIAMISALVYIELGTSIPESGSDFSYISFVGWHSLAFAFLWLSSIVKSSCSCAVLFLTFGDYVVKAIEPATELSSWEKKWIPYFAGFLLLLLFTWINLFSLARYASRIHIVVTVAKVTTLAAIIVTGGYYLIFKGRTSHFSSAYIFANSKWSAGQIALAIYSGNWAFGGYDTLNFGTEEVELKNKKTLPRAVVGGLLLATVLYIVANVAYFVILSPQEILDSNAVATTFISSSLGEGVSYAMPAIVGVLICGTLNSDIFTWSRFMMAGARRGMMPSAWALVNPNTDSPRVAVIVHSILSVAFSFIGDIDTLLNYLTVTGLLQQGVAVAALILIKWKKIPVSRDAVKFPIWLPIFVLLQCVFLIVLPLFEDVVTTLVGLGCFLLFWASYALFKYYPLHNIPLCKRIDDVIRVFCEKLFSCELEEGPSYEKEEEMTTSRRSTSKVSDIERF